MTNRTSRDGEIKETARARHASGGPRVRVAHCVPVPTCGIAAARLPESLITWCAPRARTPRAYTSFRVRRRPKREKDDGGKKKIEIKINRSAGWPPGEGYDFIRIYHLYRYRRRSYVYVRVLRVNGAFRCVPGACDARDRFFPRFAYNVIYYYITSRAHERVPPVLASPNSGGSTLSVRARPAGQGDFLPTRRHTIFPTRVLCSCTGNGGGGGDIIL